MSPWGLAFLPILLGMERAFTLNREAKRQAVWDEHLKSIESEAATIRIELGTLKILCDSYRSNLISQSERIFHIEGEIRRSQNQNAVASEDQVLRELFGMDPPEPVKKPDPKKPDIIQRPTSYERIVNDLKDE